MSRDVLVDSAEVLPVNRADQAVRLTRALELIEDARRSLALPRLGGNPERQLASAETILRGVRDELAGVK